MKIVFMGTPDFAVHVLTALCEAGHTVCGVVTQPDRPRGRKMEIVPGPVCCEARRLGIEVYQPEKIRGNEEILTCMKNMQPDAVVVAAFGQIIPKSILDLPLYGCFNVHASLLPDYRGAAPIQHAILDGREKTGVTIMRMNEGLDTGDIVSTREIPILPDETGGSLFDRLAKCGAELLVETLPKVEEGTATYTPQPAVSPTPYASMITKNSGKIDWTKSAEEIERMIRAMNPWPSAWTRLDGKTLKIWHAAVGKPGMEGTPGLVVRQDAGGLYIETGSGILIADELQLEGRRRMKASDFLRGYVIRNPQLGQEKYDL
ncbi:MAG: methionyl-tRNA formyltransferase [Lachnospiraceae bacterium]|nr:methionyl-tRNA formyltransferase [Lachnospiraceae bacterium]